MGDPVSLLLVNDDYVDFEADSIFDMLVSVEGFETTPAFGHRNNPSLSKN